MQSDLRIVGPFHAMSGYSKFARAALLAARAAGFRVQAVESDGRECVEAFTDGTRRVTKIPYADKSKLPEHQAQLLKECEREEVPADCPTLLIQMPGQLSGWSEVSRGPRLGWTMSESDTLHPLWARACQNVDLLCLPSRFCEEVFRAAVPQVETRLLPCPVDPALYTPEGICAAIGGRPETLFFSCFATVERKGWRTLLHAFAEEFVGESVGLIVLPSRRAEVEEMADWCRSLGAWIHIVEPGVSEEDLAGLYRVCDAFALPSAEGFGLPFVEAALLSKPSVALNAGGAADIVTEETGYPVQAHYTPSVGHIPPIYPSSHCFPSASVSAVRAALRRCVEEAGERREARGNRAREFALSHFTPDAVAPLLFEAVEAACTCHEGERRVWQGAGEKSAPLTVLIHAQDAARAASCAGRLGATTKNVRILFLCAEEATFEALSEAGYAAWVDVFWHEDSPVEARKKALARLEAEGFWGSVAMIDDTIAVTPGWWAGLAKVFAIRPDVGVLSPQIALWNGKRRGGSFLRFDASRRAGALQRNVIVCDMAEPDCYILRPEVWRSVTYDPQFAWHYDAADVSVQARAQGFETAATARVTVNQTERPCGDKDYLFDNARRAFLRKWKGAF